MRKLKLFETFLCQRVSQLQKPLTTARRSRDKMLWKCKLGKMLDLSTMRRPLSEVGSFLQE